MKRILVLTIALLLAPWVYSACADPQEGDQQGLPNPAAFPPAGPQCKSKVKVRPWLATPAVDFLQTSRCVLEVNTCSGAKKYKSSARPNGAAMCDDYRKVLDTLANREICCDRDSRQETQPPAKKPSG